MNWNGRGCREPVVVRRAFDGGSRPRASPIMEFVVTGYQGPMENSDPAFWW